MAEAFNSLFKAELVRNRGPWNGIDDLELAVAEYIDWYNHRRPHDELGLIPPVEHEALHTAHNLARQPVEAGEPSLHQTRHLTDGHRIVRRVHRARKRPARRVERGGAGWPVRGAAGAA